MFQHKNSSNIVTAEMDDIHPYENNPRINGEAVKYVAESIRQFGFRNPIILDADGVIIAGHTRYDAAKKLGMREVPVIYADDLTPEQVKAYRLADNKTAEKSEWDFDLLELELDEIKDIDMELLGFDDFLDDEPQDMYNQKNAKNLFDRFIMPPFSTLDARSGKWQERKRKWKSLGLDSQKGRDDALLGAGLRDLAKRHSKNTELTGTSIFDPVLCETMLRWFCPEGGRVFDCFAGGSVRGVVSSILGYQYTGIDLRQEQIDMNYENASDMQIVDNLPVWICDDSLNADAYVQDDSVDFLLSCPPYADLEVYSDDPRDISTMSYDDFLKTYRQIITIACRKLKDNSFAVFVVGDVRDKKGFYRDFVGDTKKIFRDNGLLLYNDMILLESISTAALRAGKQFSAMRKVCKTHQNVLVFYRGDPKVIKEKHHEIDVDDLIRAEILDDEDIDEIEVDFP